jgi:hypothetical protein
MRDDEVDAHERTNDHHHHHDDRARARTHRARIPHRSRANKRTDTSRGARARQ